MNMRVVYTLEAEARNNPATVSNTQKLTLDRTRPFSGLSGRHGLFCSETWWENIRLGRIPKIHVSGRILDVFSVTEETNATNDTVVLALDDGSTKEVGIYVNNPADLEWFVVGKKMEVTYALDELKLQPSARGGINNLKIALEVKVSE
jgi:hypothetical protein